MMDLVIAVVGEVKSSNIEDFKKEIFAQIDEIKDYELETEQDFLDAAQIVNDLKYAEQAIENAREEALNQTTDVRDLFNAMTEIANKVHKTWYQLEKKVKADKAEKKENIIAAGFESVRNTLFKVITESEIISRNMFQDDFLLMIKGATKNKKKLENIQQAVDKIVVEINHSIWKRAIYLAENYELIKNHPGHLFPDIPSLIQKSREEVTAIIDARIAKYSLDLANAALLSKNEEDIAAAKAHQEQDKKVVDDYIHIAEKHEYQHEHEPLVEHHVEAEVKFTPPADPVVKPPSPIPSVQAQDRFTLTFTITADTDRAKFIAVAVDKAIRGFKEVGQIYFKRVR